MPQTAENLYKSPVLNEAQQNQAARVMRMGRLGKSAGVRKTNISPVSQNVMYGSSSPSLSKEPASPLTEREMASGLSAVKQTDRIAAEPATKEAADGEVDTGKDKKKKVEVTAQSHKKNLATNYLKALIPGYGYILIFKQAVGKARKISLLEILILLWTNIWFLFGSLAFLGIVVIIADFMSKSFFEKAWAVIKAISGLGWGVVGTALSTLFSK